MIKKKGYALATILILLGVCLFGAAAVVTSSILESRISMSQKESVTAYYVAEAGMHDALWRLNNDTTYNAALAAGNLTAHYTASDTPQTNQSIDVTLASTSAGYATVTVIGTSNNSVFTSKRQIQATVFLGPGTSPTGSNVMLFGGALSITNGSSAFSVTGGDMFANTSVTINSATVNIGTGVIATPGNYTANSGSTVTAGQIKAQNLGNPPTAPYPQVPTFDFSYYSTHSSRVYTPAQFQTFVSGSGSTVNIAGPITYISGNLTMNSWARNKTFNISGVLIINGSLSVTSSASGTRFNFTDPGSGFSGLYTNGTTNIAIGTWNVQGVVYCSQSITLTNNNNMTIDGALIGAQGASLNTGLGLNLNYNASRVIGGFGSGTARPLSVSYWEEEY